MHRRVWIGAAAAVAVVAICAGAFVGLTYWPGYWPVSSKALNHSLSHEVGVPVFPGFGCRPSGAGVKLCTVYDTQSSGSATYAVQMRGRRCWFASKVSGAEEGRPLPHFASGCVGLFDRLGLLD